MNIPKQVWIISCFFCCFSLFLYFLVFPNEKNTPYQNQDSLEKSQEIQPIQAEENFSQNVPNNLQENSAYLKWLSLGKKAQSQGKWAEAIRSYHIALSYQKNPALEKHLENLQKTLEEERKKKLDYLEKAKFYEETENYNQALSAYQTIYDQKPSKEIQTKIEFCRQILLAEEKADFSLEKIEKFLLLGEYQKAMDSYQELLLECSVWAAYSQKFQAKLTDAKESLLQLEKSASLIFLWLKEKRSSKALLFLKAQKVCFSQAKLLECCQNHLYQDMVKIPSGTFWMGGEAEEDEYPLHQVDLSEYYIDRFEVTNLMYSYFINSTGYEKPEKWTSSLLPEEEQLPVEGISWDDASSYSEWAGKRLPSEAEWEKAARGKNKSLYPWGNDFQAVYCNSLESGIRKTTPVGSFPKGTSPYGCHDMSGNVLEWTSDPYSRYPGGKAPLFQRQGYRVARGGSWYYKQDAIRCSNRYPLLSTVRLDAVGFRCAFSENNAK
ncbi:MAG: SUMF1/EgtB/PvdO family nonheme iron enzyme [Candidatus Brocadiae bacterium]|nr:SUMF1/EgtB/PvdO family nonheme iron enzyme [Candidatus Brocadiia bacterium]